MWPNRYWTNYWADRYWAPVGSGGGAAPSSNDVDKNYFIGIGMMGKPRIHPHPIFSRHKQ